MFHKPLYVGATYCHRSRRHVLYERAMLGASNASQGGRLRNMAASAQSARQTGPTDDATLLNMTRETNFSITQIDNWFLKNIIILSVEIAIRPRRSLSTQVGDVDEDINNAPKSSREGGSVVSMLGVPTMWPRPTPCTRNCVILGTNTSQLSFERLSILLSTFVEEQRQHNSISNISQYRCLFTVLMPYLEAKY